MAGATFTAECPGCGERREFEEFQRERRRVSRGGDFGFELEFSFRCRGCGRREEKLVDVDGVVHKWSGAKHATFRP